MNVLIPSLTVPDPAVKGGFVLYLDFDGVLHPEDVHMQTGRGPFIASPVGHKLFEHAGLLAEALGPYPELRIVLSTSWVRVYRSVRRITRKLPPELSARVVGATYHGAMDAESFKAAPRGMQVWSDVLRRQPADWLALDDDYLHWPAWCRDKLVRTDEILGVSAPAVLAELRAKLAAMPEKAGDG
ncbi:MULTISPECIES: HAD domain-containing protein [unclassified Caballeronia]|uniref:HAD domain-containing protein n=1 Tax=unclassified Caballeronia TaxID=2646786 RepID=UPI00285C85A4|nr:MULTISPECIES: HAD domain-containing protein [unclassified Caballeronia]MDR5750361.1 HAD domain-containing protein [Caballeronia sp. LZ024]MDR5842607.1 HAD domain-containing protein [Caballeronia sp. LZ031]